MQCAAISRSFRSPSLSMSLDFGGELRQVRVHVATVRVGELLDLAQEVVGAGIRRVRRPIAADAADVVAVPALNQLGILLEARLADGGAVLVPAASERARLGVVYATGDDGAHTELGGSLGAG